MVYSSPILKQGDAIMRWASILSVLAAVFVGAAHGAEDADVAALLASLKDEQAHVRAAAALGLTNHKPPAEEAIPALIEALSDKDVLVRSRSAEALTQIGRKPELVIPAFVKLLGSRDAGDRVIGADGLARFTQQPETALPPLLRAVKDDSPLVRWRAIEAMRNYKPNQLEPPERRVQLLKESLQDTDRAVRRAATIALATFPAEEEKVVAALEGALTDKDEQVRGWAALGLGGRKSARRLFSSVEPLLKDADAWPRLRAAEALYRLDAKEGQAAVLKMLKAGDPAARASAAEALGGFRAEPAPVIAGLSGALGDGDVTVRFRAVRSLKGFGSQAKSAVPALTRAAVEDRDATVRAAAADALGAIGPDATSAVPTILSIVARPSTPAERQAAADALIRITQNKPKP
jgi:HEAT repeat protein